MSLRRCRGFIGSTAQRNDCHREVLWHWHCRLSAQADSECSSCPLWSTTVGPLWEALVLWQISCAGALLEALLPVSVSRAWGTLLRVCCSSRLTARARRRAFALRAGWICFGKHFR